MSVQIGNKRKSLQINGTPNAKGPKTPSKLQAQTPKSNQKQNNANINGNNSAKNNKANKKRSLSPSNAAPAAKTPKLEKFAGTANLNESNNTSAKKQKQGPSPGGRADQKRDALRERRSASKTNFGSMIEKCLQGDVEARKLVTEKIKDLESVPNKSKTAIRKLRQMRKSIGETSTSEEPITNPSVDKKKAQKLQEETKMDQEEESSEEETEMKVDGEDDVESEDESDEVAEESKDATLNEEESDEEESDDAEDEEDSDGEDEEESDDAEDEEADESEDESNVVVEASKKTNTTNVLGTVNNKNAIKKELPVKEKQEESKFIVYVGNVDFKVTKEDLLQHFEKVGKVVEVNWVTNPGSTFEHNGNAFVQFQDLESFEKSVTLHQTMLKDRRLTILYTNNGSRTPEIYALLNKSKGPPANNRPGNNFQNNKPGNNFQNNRPGNKFQNNRPGNNFQNRPKNNFQNKQGNNFNKGPRNFQNGNSKFENGAQ